MADLKKAFQGAKPVLLALMAFFILVPPAVFLTSIIGMLTRWLIIYPLFFFIITPIIFVYTGYRSLKNGANDIPTSALSGAMVGALVGAVFAIFTFFLYWISGIIGWLIVAGILDQFKLRPFIEALVGPSSSSGYLGLYVAGALIIIVIASTYIFSGLVFASIGAYIARKINR